MAKRFDYVRMTAAELAADLEALAMPPMAFGRIFGFDERRISQWLAGAEDIPIWVPVVTAMLKHSPGAIAEARQEAAKRIRFDHARPEDGEFPYLKDD